LAFGVFFRKPTLFPLLWTQTTRAKVFDNEVAINLYDKHGFEKVSVRKNYYQDGSDAYVMVKDLTRRKEEQ